MANHTALENKSENINIRHIVSGQHPAPKVVFKISQFSQKKDKDFQNPFSSKKIKNLQKRSATNFEEKKTHSTTNVRLFSRFSVRMVRVFLESKKVWRIALGFRVFCKNWEPLLNETN